MSDEEKKRAVDLAELSASLKGTADTFDRKDIAKAGDSMKSATRGVRSLLEDMNRHYGMLNNAMGSVGSSFKAASGPLGDAISRLSVQRELLNTASQPTLSIPAIPDVRIPSNPLIETNKRLAKIQARFEEMREIALNAAQIATSLQAYAAEFLLKFEAAANETDRSARRAVRIGILALIIAIATPVGQTLYSSYVIAPAELAVSQIADRNFQLQLNMLRRRQENTSKAIAEAIIKSDDRTAGILREIRDKLSEQSPDKMRGSGWLHKGDL